MNNISGVKQEHECPVLEKYNSNGSDSEITVQKLNDGHWYWIRYSDKRGNVADGIGYCPYCGTKLN